MPLNRDIKKVLVIGSGPIIIGQAAEFDYAGTQACRALKEENIEIVLVNSNPATIMTDSTVADKIYIEPLTIPTIKRIIEKEKPDSILSGLGGQTGLTICMQLARDGFLKKNNVKLLGASPETIDKAEDRQLFKQTMESINQPCVPSIVVNEVEGAVKFAEEIGYPVIVRPAFTLGGTGGGIVNNQEELEEIAENGINLSPINQILVERCISGWKEIEFEVMRDAKGNVITVCSMENFDPVGVHTGDSIVIAPCVTLADKEYQMLRSAALSMISTLEIEGGCNCQFALNPNSFEYAVIEVNPRVSRSSALASKATGYPIAKVSTKIAIGYTLDEIMNTVTGKTYAAFEPALDYVAVKFPKWPFDKFVYAKRELGTQMKATGEVMSISDSFPSAIMKAVRGAEIGLETLNLAKFDSYSDDALLETISKPTDERLFATFTALKRGITVEKINEISKIDCWFLNGLMELVNYEKEIAKNGIDEQSYIKGKKLGYPDNAIELFSNSKVKFKIEPTYKMVDTCAGEFSAATPYFYQTFDTVESGGENEAIEAISNNKNKETIIVIGSGPIRIGQGIEFDYASVHCVWSLKKLNYNVVIINNNPETVSTDFDTSDRLYFEPLHIEDVMHIINIEKPLGVVVAFGGQTAIKLTKKLYENGIRIIGSSYDCIDMAEDKERFDELLERLEINRPKGGTGYTTDEALKIANKLGYPVLIRPSYVIGGQNMIIASSDEDVIEYMSIILSHKQENPILIDKYLSGIEAEVDALYDGEDILIPAIMEHIERTGVHSGDSIAMYPPKNIDDNLAEKILDITKKICVGINALGLVNVQYIIKDNEVYVIEVNPRASRTVPYLSKVTGVPIVDLATKISLGEKLCDMDYGTGIYSLSPYTTVKVPVFSFEKLTNVDTQLGPEMKSTGEVLGIGKNLEEALYKGLIAAGYNMKKCGGIFVTVRDGDKLEIADIVKKLANIGFSIYSTEGTAKVLIKQGLKVQVVAKIQEGKANNPIKLLESKKISYVISTSAKGRNPARDSVKIRRKASMLGIPCLTSMDTANAVADILHSRYSEMSTELVDINDMRIEKMKLHFTKMQGAGNDHIYINAFNQTIDSPESLAIFLSDRNFGIGGDGLVLIYPSDIADARIKLFNLDGSERKMSGNAIRCVGKYLYDNKMVSRKNITIETASGLKYLELFTTNGFVDKVTVNMGAPILNPKKIPVKLSGDRIVGREVEIENEKFVITCVSMGNPHCIIFTNSVENVNVDKYGSMIENSPIFPNRVNVEFVEVIDRTTLKIRVWERGCGETVASGTGASAAIVASVLSGYCDKDTEIKAILKGGNLKINYSDEAVFLTGSCEKVYEGVMEI
jgi:carbamoyl-phosphate synthase large subunit